MYYGVEGRLLDGGRVGVGLEVGGVEVGDGVWVLVCVVGVVWVEEDCGGVV